MKKKIKNIFNKITNKDVIPDDIPLFYHLKHEDLKCCQVEVMEDDNDYIEEVFEYNTRAAKCRILLVDIEEAKKGFYKANLCFIFLSLVVLFIYECIKKEGYNMLYGYLAVAVFSVVYIFSRFFKKTNIYLNVFSAFFLIVVNKVFVIAVITNIILGHVYDRAVKKVKGELGYPNFPSVDLVLCLKNGQYKKIFAREME